MWVAFNEDTFVLTLQIRESSAKTSKGANFFCSSHCLASIWSKTLFNFSKPGLVDRKDSARSRNHRTNDNVKFNARLTRARRFHEDSPLRQPTHRHNLRLLSSSFCWKCTWKEVKVTIISQAFRNTFAISTAPCQSSTLGFYMKGVRWNFAKKHDLCSSATHSDVMTLQILTWSSFFLLWRMIFFYQK